MKTTPEPCPFSAGAVLWSTAWFLSRAALEFTTTQDDHLPYTPRPGSVPPSPA